MRRTTLALFSRGIFATSMSLRSPAPPSSSSSSSSASSSSFGDDRKLEEFAQNFKMEPMHSQPRSEHRYEASTKGAEVGARNEAAYMNYELFKPMDVKGIFATPHVVSMLTITPIYCAIICIASVGWGIFYWDLYCRRWYEPVLIARPERL